MVDELPRARRDDLLIEDVLDELLIYDLRSEQAHSLNAAAAAIWRACDGHTSVEALAAATSAATGAHCDEGIVRLALERLQERGLLDAFEPPARRPMSRREMIERVAVTALALPLITSLSVPSPAMAQSCPLMGPQGPQGMQGPQGPQGIQGPQGECLCDPLSQSSPEAGGFQGFQGETFGPQGFQGPGGFQGDCGFQNFVQDSQAQGLAGLRDCQGPQGFSGPQGPPTVCGPQML